MTICNKYVGVNKYIVTICKYICQQNVFIREPVHIPRKGMVKV